MIDDDERAALERELAADLTDVNLNDDNVGVEPNEVAGITTTGGEIGLAHRDLDERLRAVGQQQIEEEKQASGSAGELSTWELLLQSVDQSDREFFGAMNADIDNIRAILTSESDGEKQQIEAPIQEGNGESGLPSPLLTGALPKQRWEQQQLEAVQWLSQLEKDVERLNDEQQRRERERSEATERSLMDREERRARQYVEQLREHRSRAEMQVEEAISLALSTRMRRELQREQAERCGMEDEDAASRQVELWLKQQAVEQRLLQEKNFARRLFNCVLLSLVERHRVEQAEQQKRLELERRRQTRESSLMRAEEAQTRRWLAQTRAVVLECERLSNRIAMGAEDELSHEVERLERRTRAEELRSCRKMHEQEEYSARADVEPEIVEEEEEDSEMMDAWGEEAADAVMLVQSAFRGFFVRCKFQAALDLAREVGDGDDDAAFDEVNLDDLIELPPELADGWEDPMLPRVSRRIPVVQVTSGGEQDSGGGDDDDDDERDDGADDAQFEAAMTSRNSRKNNMEEGDGSAAAAPVAKEANLAASLWSKMMRTKQKQRWSVEERARQQDPTYLVQKPLHPKRKGKPPLHQGGPAAGPTSADKAQGGAPTIAWTTSSNPSKPKTKLPSLVERLRKKTAAERASG